MAERIRGYAVAALGEVQLASYEKNGYLETLANNGHTYFIFAPVPAGQVGHRYSYNKMSWCVFGYDPREELKLPSGSPQEHFMAYRSLGAHELFELVWIWMELKTNATDFVIRGCDPLITTVSRPKRKVTDQMLKKIGRTLTERDYTLASLRRASRKRSSSSGSARSRKAAKAA